MRSELSGSDAVSVQGFKGSAFRALCDVGSALWVAGEDLSQK
jgi:hypothetical protein